MVDGEYTELDDAPVFVTALGMGEPVLSLHGPLFDQRVWWHQVRTSRPQLRVICPGLLETSKHAQSERPARHG